MSWSRAIWLENKQEEEGTIPTAWIKNNLVYWPSFLNVEKAAAELKEPTALWHKFPLVRVKITGGTMLSGFTSIN